MLNSGAPAEAKEGEEDEDKIDWRTLQPADFVAEEVPSNLGERFVDFGKQLQSMLNEAERDEGASQRMLKQGADTLANLQRAQDYKLTTARAKAEKAALPVPAGDGAMDGAAALAPVPAAPPSSTRPSTEPPDVLGDVATGSC